MFIRKGPDEHAVRVEDDGDLKKLYKSPSSPFSFILIPISCSRKSDFVAAIKLLLYQTRIQNQRITAQTPFNVHVST